VNSTNSTLDEIKDLLEELLAMIEAEGDEYKFRGFGEALKMADAATEDPEIARELGNRIVSMFRGFGSGTFNDYGIWRDDFEERRALNSRLEELSNRLYELAEAL